MRRSEKFFIIIPVCFTILVGWFSWSAFRIAPQMAADSLRGQALSIATAIEALTTVEPDPEILSQYSTEGLAYFFVVDRNGIILFHTNPALVGTMWTGPKPDINSKSGIHEERKKLGTGEEIYELQTRIHPTGGNCLLTLALHTYQSDLVIRRTHTAIMVTSLLTFALWLVTVGIMYLLCRDKQRQLKMQRQEELAQLGELGAVIAHEIRNPLAGIKGFVQLIAASGDMDEARLYAKKVVHQSLRMEALVDDLLAYAREDKVERQLTDLTPLIQDCVAMIRMEADTAGVEVVYTPKSAIYAEIDYDRIIQLLLNLLKNGLQSMPNGGVLRVESKRSHYQAIITIGDSGIGIPPENIPHIFKPFWTDKAKGTGLGLALCSKVAHAHGGNLTVMSTVGVGTTFTITLPMEK
ncbi:MAG: ATP-binding protein [Desulfuromonadaceae bacterium]|nr:ATP-binding protein [Desulfuromonadaceae bacterium]MDD2847680.1 ATP-binding protein [Desulfuromonadaceae bacterium]MDD4131074.1 ATP-binding protein [Desulfuromonadaceae bacterium]